MKTLGKAQNTYIGENEKLQNKCFDIFPCCELRQKKINQKTGKNFKMKQHDFEKLGSFCYTKLTFIMIPKYMLEMGMNY